MWDNIICNVKLWCPVWLTLYQPDMLVSNFWKCTYCKYNTSTLFVWMLHVVNNVSYRYQRVYYPAAVRHQISFGQYSFPLMPYDVLYEYYKKNWTAIHWTSNSTVFSKPPLTGFSKYIFKAYVMCVYIPNMLLEIGYCFPVHVYPEWSYHCTQSCISTGC